MASSLSVVVAKDGAGTTVAGGLLAVDKSGAGTGPFFQANTLADTQGVNTLTIKAASTAPATTDTTAVVGAADGNIVTLGITTGTAVTTNASGTIQQYLRGVVSLLVSGITVASHAVTNAGTFAVQVSNANANGSATSANSAPVVIASDQAAVKTLPGVTATASGATASRVLAAASTNATSLKASAGQLYTLDVFNAAAYNVFLKLYNKASAPTVGTDTPVMTIPVQAGGGYSKTWPMGFTFGTGIAYAITKLQADSDTTVLVAGDLTGNTTWI